MAKRAYHWFTSSFTCWSANDVLSDALAQQYKTQAFNCKSLKKDSVPVAIWRVPGDSAQAYEIQNFRPMVDGAVFVGYDSGALLFEARGEVK